MSTYSNWLTANITDPTAIYSELYIALQQLDALLDVFTNADGIAFTDDSFYSDVCASVGDALREIGDFLVSSSTLRRLITIPSYGAALVDATNIFSIVCNRAGVLGVAYAILETAPVGTPTVIQIKKNASSLYAMTFAVGEFGPLSLDLSFISVVPGDIISLFCTTASGAKGLACTMEY